MCSTGPYRRKHLVTPRVEIFSSATDGFKNWGVICNTLICCEFPHFMPQMTPNFCELAPAQSILQKIIRFFCLRVDPNPQSQQRGRSFLCVTMFPGWHAKEYLCRFSEQQISRTNCAQTVISKFAKAFRLIFCMRLDVSCFVVFHIERVTLLKANMLVSRHWECTSI